MEGQKLLCAPENWQKVLALIPSEDIRERLHENWTKGQPKKKGAVLDEAAPLARWTELKQRVAKKVRVMNGKAADRYSRENTDLKACVQRITSSNAGRTSGDS